MILLCPSAGTARRIVQSPHQDCSPETREVTNPRAARCVCSSKPSCILPVRRNLIALPIYDLAGINASASAPARSFSSNGFGSEG